MALDVAAALLVLAVQVAVTGIPPASIRLRLVWLGFALATALGVLVRRRFPLPLLVVAVVHLDQYVVAALAAGASGFLLKDTPPRQIVAAVRAVAEGSEMLSPAVTRRLIAEYVRGHDDSRRAAALRRLAVLSGREREILVLVARGLSNAEAARAAYMTEATVKTYVSRMLTKLDLANRTQAAILAHEAGLLDD